MDASCWGASGLLGVRRHAAGIVTATAGLIVLSATAWPDRAWHYRRTAHSRGAWSLVSLFRRLGGRPRSWSVRMGRRRDEFRLACWAWWRAHWERCGDAGAAAEVLVGGEGEMPFITGSAGGVDSTVVCSEFAHTWRGCWGALSTRDPVVVSGTFFALAGPPSHGEIAMHFIYRRTNGERGDGSHRPHEAHREVRAGRCVRGLVMQHVCLSPQHLLRPT